MTPDRGFVKQLKTLDKELEVVWDWGATRWEIWKFPELGQPYLVTRVQATGKGYRELGQDVLINLQWHMQLGPKRILAYLEEHNNQLRRRRAKKFQEKIRAIADDAWGPLFTIHTQVPKAYNIEKPLINKVAEVI